MLFPKWFSKRLAIAVALSGSLVMGGQILTLASGNPGLTIFSGVERKDQLNYYLDFGGRPRNRDRYKLYVPGKKLTQGARRFFISYPEYYNGEFKTDKIEVRVGRESLPIREVIWDKESRLIQIDMLEDVEPGTKVNIVMSNVRNPDAGTYYFRCDVQAAGEIPVRLFAGVWIISIDK